MNNDKLLSPFPKELVKKAPAGKFGDYVPHANYVERLRDSGVQYSWSCEPVYGTFNGEKRIAELLEEVRTGLEKKVAEKTNNLNTLVENLDQGFFTINKL